MKVSVTFTFRCDNLWNSKFMASGKAWETRWFFSRILCGQPVWADVSLAGYGGWTDEHASPARSGPRHRRPDVRRVAASQVPRSLRPHSASAVELRRTSSSFIFIFPRKQHQTCNKSLTARTGQPGIKAWTYSSPIIKCRFLGEKKTIYRNNTFTVLRMIISNR